MKYISILFVLFFLEGQISAQQSSDWTWLYKKIFSPEERAHNAEKSVITFHKGGTPEFTQLIFSWNAERPIQGFYRFKVQVKSTNSKKWSDWYTMMEWGSHIQQSFLKKSLSGINYHHVRLELPKNITADGLRISIEALDGACCSGIHAVFACLAHYQQFKAETMNEIKHLPSTIIHKVPKQSQMMLNHHKKEVLCSPTSCSMLVSYLMKKRIDPVLFADNAYDAGLNAYGSWPFNVAHAFEVCKGKYLFHVERLSSFSSLYHYLRKKIPVVVSVRGKIIGAPKEYNDGHLLLVVGWDQYHKKVICHDPAIAHSKETRVAYDARSFIRAWELSRRLAYIATGV